MWHSQKAYQTEQFLLKKFYDSMLSLESDEMTVLWPNDRLIFTFYLTFSNRIQNWTTFVTKVFYLMFSLQSDKMTVLGPNDNLTFTFYVTFSNSKPNWTTFVKEVFLFNVELRKGQKDCFVTKWQLNFHFLCDNLK